MVQFLFELKAYFDQVYRDINLKNAYRTRLEQTKEVTTVAWDLSNAYEKEVYNLETELREYLDKKASLDEQISERHARVAKLTKEIHNLEKQKAELVWEKSLSTWDIIDQKATKGVKHTEVALGLGLKIDLLEETFDCLTTRLNFSKTKLEDFKSKFPI